MKELISLFKQEALLLQVNRFVSIKPFSGFKRLSSSAGETVHGIPEAAFIIDTYLPNSGTLQVQGHYLKRSKLDCRKRIILKGHPATLKFMMCFYAFICSGIHTI